MIVAGDPMHAHLAHCAPSAVVGVGDLPQQRDHAQLLQQYGVERNLVDAVEDLARRAGVSGRSTGLI